MTIKSAIDIDEITARLQTWLQVRTGDAEAFVDELSIPKASGFSNETVMFRATWIDGDGVHGRELVARVQPAVGGIFPHYDVVKEARIIAALETTPVPVPEILWIEDDTTVFGSPFCVMGRLEGRLPLDDPPFTASGWVLDLAPKDRAKVLDESIRTLAALHAVDVSTLDIPGLDSRRAGETFIDGELRWCDEYYAWIGGTGSNPVIDEAFAYVRDRKPAEDGYVALNWGDARLPNLVFDDALACVGMLDWETASLANPGVDLGWFVFGNLHHTVGLDLPHPDGFPSPEETIARYEELSGRKLENLEFYIAFAGLKIALTIARVGQLMKEHGLVPPDSTLEFNNPATKVLVPMLGLSEAAGEYQNYVGKR